MNELDELVMVHFRGDMTVNFLLFIASMGSVEQISFN